MNYVSVVIPSKNAGQSFRQTLESIYYQQVPFRFEVVIVDSGSTDDTLRIWQAKAVQGTAIDPSNPAQPRPPGSVVAAGKQGIDVVTGDGLLRITQLQAPGKRPMPVLDFINARSLDGTLLV